MTIIQKMRAYIKKKNNLNAFFDNKTFKIQKFNPLIVISFLVVFSIIFFVSSNLLNKKNEIINSGLNL